MKRSFQAALLLIVLAISIVSVAAVSGQAAGTDNPTPVRTVTDDEVNAIAHKLYCPVCENITLDTCGTAACADWRYEIRLQLEAGMSEAQITEDFVRRFGDRVVGTPLDPALRALSLYTPWVLVGIALIGGSYVVLKRRSGKTSPSLGGSASADHYQEMFERDVAGS